MNTLAKRWPLAWFFSISPSPAAWPTVPHEHCAHVRRLTAGLAASESLDWATTS
jgi:hypothetical protein